MNIHVGWVAIILIAFVGFYIWKHQPVTTA